MTRSICVAVMLLSCVPAQAQSNAKVLIPRPKEPIWDVQAEGMDLTDDLGLTPYDGIAATRTAAVGAENARRINQALADGWPNVGDPIVTSLGDKYGHSFAVASDDPGRPYSIYIPTGYGGKLYGTGAHDRTYVSLTNAPASRIGGTTFFNVTDDSVVPYENQEVIRYEGVYWSIGPLTLNGCFAAMASPQMGVEPGSPGDNSAVGKYLRGEIAGAGFKVADPSVPVNAGRILGAIGVVNCQNGVVWTKDAGAMWTFFAANQVHNAYVVQHNQAVNHTFHKARVGRVDRFFNFLNGGALQVYGVDWNAPSVTLLRIGSANFNSRRYEIHGINIDSAVFPATGPGSNPTRLLQMTQPNKVSVRMSGNMAGQIASWPDRLVEPQGLAHDIELDFVDLPQNMAVPFSRKPYPTTNPTIFYSPDPGLDESVLDKNDVNKSDFQLWLDTPDGGTITQQIAGQISKWDDESGNGHDVMENTSSAQPRYTHDGLHHRPAAQFISGDQLARPAVATPASTPTGFSGMNDLEVWLVASLAKTGRTFPRTGVLASVWRVSAGQRCWRLEHRQNSGGEGGNQIRLLLSTDGNATSTWTTDAVDSLPFDTPLLILVRYNSATGEVTLDVDDRAVGSLVSGDNPISGPLQSTSTARLGIGCSFNGNDIAVNRFVGRIGFVAVKSSLSNADQDSGMRSYLRRKFGVW